MLSLAGAVALPATAGAESSSSSSSSPDISAETPLMDLAVVYAGRGSTQNVFISPLPFAMILSSRSVSQSPFPLASSSFAVESDT
jgi:hypothetical protein